MQNASLIGNDDSAIMMNNTSLLTIDDSVMAATVVSGGSGSGGGVDESYDPIALLIKQAEDNAAVLQSPACVAQQADAPMGEITDDMGEGLCSLTRSPYEHCFF